MEAEQQVMIFGQTFVEVPDVQPELIDFEAPFAECGAVKVALSAVKWRNWLGGFTPGPCHLASIIEESGAGMPVLSRFPWLMSKASSKIQPMSSELTTTLWNFSYTCLNRFCADGVRSMVALSLKPNSLTAPSACQSWMHVCSSLKSHDASTTW